MVERTGRHSYEFITNLGKRLAEGGWWHSFELPDGRSFKGASSIDDQRRRLALFPIPEDLKGRRVLDIGAWEGWFSFEMERRGAEVVAIDCVPSRNFQYIHRELGSKVDYRILDMYELTPERLGYFDIVLFLGVLYHLKHPLLGLERVCALTRDLALVETFTSPDPGPPVMEFYEGTELGGRFDNWVGPNVACVLAWCRTAGFARVELLNVNHEAHALVACYRRFSEGQKTLRPAPVLGGVEEMMNFGINFRSTRDDYVSCFFTINREELDLGELQARVAHLDAVPVFLGRVQEAWQINFKLPLGLERGWHEVRVRTKDSAWSNPQRLAVDIPLEVESLTITGACDGQNWRPGEVTLSDEPVLSLWVRGVPENASKADLAMDFGGHAAAVTYLSAWEPGEPSQVNTRLPEGIEPGDYPVTVSCANVSSEGIVIRAARPIPG